MIFVVLIPFTFAQVFQKTYSQQNLTLSYQLNEEEQYVVTVRYISIQMKVLEFPSQENLLPYLNVNNVIDDQAFSTRSIYHHLIVNNTQTIQIQVGQSIVSEIPQSNSNKSMVFQLTIISSKIRSLQCAFPHYGVDCSNSIDSYEIDVIYNFKVKPKSWQFLYYNLSDGELQVLYYNNQLCIKNTQQMFGVAVRVTKQSQYTQLPSFTSQYETIYPNQELQITINDQTVSEDIQNHIFIIGIYNFNINSTQQLQLSVILTKQSILFPMWAIGVIITIIAFGFILVVVLCYQMNTKEDKIRSKPKLDLKILEKYMPILHQPIYQNQIVEDHEVCSICLDQFKKKSKIRRTTCDHLFHNQCLLDWTFKQSNCPVCRQSFEKQDLEKYINYKMEQNQLNIGTQNFIQFPSTTRIITSKRNERVERLNDSMQRYVIV